MRFGRKTKESEPGFQLAPMIDIVFQILIFFMVVSVMKVQETVELDLPVAAEAQKREGGTPQELVINVLKDGTIIVNQYPYSLLELGNFLQATIKGKNVKLYLRSDKDANAGKIMDIIELCGKLNIWDISFATFMEEEK